MLVLIYLDVMLLLTGYNAEQMLTIVEQIMKRFETVDLGDARFLLE